MADVPVVLSVFLNAVPGREEELANHLSALVGPTRKEAGCEAYELHRDPAAPEKFFFYERFRNEDALTTHVNAPHFQEFLAYRAEGQDPVASQNVIRWSQVIASEVE